ncbi:hypothetical protein CAC42_5311 [Sphaceloma murrayae]|uniref:Pyridoxamine 5'-phosphate oxidase Alr4036 family FMN-binding domain-containing protein n=1 Tax=Sphaceloma murrayae TaxID=2082308 RepID=A0A2K1QUN9_9PEZI|nr:hypothetical protein CAC42_5311 [Sphaceloma murrayae]
MATVSSTETPQLAPWKKDFLDHLGKMDSPEFVFSSLHSAPSGAPTPYVPRARYCIFRGFWAELPDNKHNQAPMNDRVYESEMPTFTTDVRMMKVPEIFVSSHGHAEKLEQTQGSGGGGPVEAVWWIKETGTQWRIKGEAYIVGPDIEEDTEQSKQSSGVRTVKSELGQRMRVVKEDGKDSWSWSKELTAHFGNNSPGLRGSFKAPPPGQPTSKPYDDKNLELGSKVEDLNDSVARKNFRVVVIRPDEVEQLDISDPTKARRQRFTFDTKSGSWSQDELWP